MGEGKPNFEGLDLAGLGKLAKAIPPEVYIQTSKTLTKTFEQIIAPVTQSTDGLGRYIKQKFDSMVEREKALAIFSLKEALRKVKEKSLHLQPPKHEKSFVNSIEEASKETDPVLHQMWVNLLASQLTDDFSHPHFVEILSHFSAAEAELLLLTKDYDSVGKHGRYVNYYEGSFQKWITSIQDNEPKPWTLSCVLLIDFGLCDVLCPPSDFLGHNFPILYRNRLGTAFLKAVGEF